jgi:signal transduction histidine kinase
MARDLHLLRLAPLVCGCLLMLLGGLAPAALSAQDGEAQPFRVFAVDASTFVVQRLRPDGRAIEGFVVDRDKLVATLRTRVLEEQGLGKLAQVAAVPQQSPGQRSWKSRSDSEPNAEYLGFASTYAFSHRFAAPFEQLKARVDLAPLEAADGDGRLLYTLLFGLAAAIVLGLYALYRMVAVQVRFAQRRSNFVAAVSHELKTPLTAIRMYGEMLRDDLVESEPKRREYYATISSETERLSRLINNVLELSRLERDQRPVQLVVGDVASVVHEVVNTLRPHAEREGFTLQVLVETPLPAARFDRDALTQVLFNLIDNALKYGRGDAERRVEVHCRALRQGVQLAVKDSGPGVAQEQLSAIFEPFYRAQDELTRTQPGTGLGLSLVQSLVQRMHGQVEGRNLGPGFEVRVTLGC